MIGKTFRRALLVSVCGLAAASIGCGGHGKPPSPSDAGADAAAPDAQVADAGQDAAADAGNDAAVDAGQTPPVDAGLDAQVADAGQDAAADAGNDAGSDAAVDAGPVCGNGVVEPGEQCDDGNTGGADGCSPTCTTDANLLGTWISKVSTTGTVTAPGVDAQPTTITVVQRMVVTATPTGVQQELQICSFDTTTLPGASTSYTTTFSQAALDTLHVTVDTLAPEINVGDAVPVPDFVIYSGEDAMGNPVDSDGDGFLGILMNAAVNGVTQPCDVLVQITTHIDGTLTDANTLTGSLSFGAMGTVYAIYSFPPCDVYGNPGCDALTVTTDQPTVPFTATRLDGDVPCNQVLAMFP